mmetsp:Transcript_37305/g.117384  ORF Transcript_37305/g.117384 Transcript_37305/m.117384 type:complete len:273 (+) Transcript_37305:467-1285(+)
MEISEGISVAYPFSHQRSAGVRVWNGELEFCVSNPSPPPPPPVPPAAPMPPPRPPSTSHTHAQQFTSTNQFDMENKMVTFTPWGSDYQVCIQSITELPEDRSGGTTISLTDDSFREIDVGGFGEITVHGMNKDKVFVSSNGMIGFTSGSTDYTPSLNDHYRTHQVALFFNDLNPAAGGGTVSYKNDNSVFTVTYWQIKEYAAGSSGSGSNTAQVSFYKASGRITMSYLGITQKTKPIIGISKGTGAPPSGESYVLDFSGVGELYRRKHPKPQ